jgi:hypothetical protein
MDANTLFDMAPDEPDDDSRYARKSDPDTSKANVNPSEQDRATRLVIELMPDMVPRIDREIAEAIPNATPDRLRHGRDQAVKMGLIVWTGRKRPTGIGSGQAREWVWVGGKAKSGGAQ